MIYNGRVLPPTKFIPWRFKLHIFMPWVFARGTTQLYSHFYPASQKTMAKELRQFYRQFARRNSSSHLGDFFSHPPSIPHLPVAPQRKMGGKFSGDSINLCSIYKVGCSSIFARHRQSSEEFYSSGQRELITALIIFFFSGRSPWRLGFFWRGINSANKFIQGDNCLLSNGLSIPKGRTGMIDTEGRHYHPK